MTLSFLIVINRKKHKDIFTKWKTTKYEKLKLNVK